MTNKEAIILLEDMGDKCTVEEAVALVMAFKALAQTRWIPVSERLPEKEGRYWVWAEIFFIPDHVNEPNSYQGSTEASFLNNHWYGKMIGKVYAWMPLPEPYKAESEEE